MSEIGRNARNILNEATEAARQFEQRWMRETLKRLDPGLAEAVQEQAEMLRAAVELKSDHEVTVHAAAMLRGWAAATKAMQLAGIAEDGVLIGEFGGITVAVGRQETVPSELVERYGKELAYLRPREVAAMYMHYRQAQDVKVLWPDAEIIEVREKAVDGGQNDAR